MPPVRFPAQHFTLLHAHKMCLVVTDNCSSLDANVVLAVWYMYMPLLLALLWVQWLILLHANSQYSVSLQDLRRAHKCRIYRIVLNCLVNGMRGSRGERDRRSEHLPYLKNHKALGSLLKNHQAALCQASIQCWVIIGPPAKRHVTLAADRWWPNFSGIWILSALIN